MHYLSEEHILIFLLQLSLLLGTARFLGEIFRRFGQPSITAEILVGIIFGPTIFGRFFPNFYQLLFPQETIQINMLETVAWLGILFFLLKTGLEIDFSSAWKQKGDALIIAFSDIIIPIIISFIPIFFIPDSFLINPSQRILFSLFIATIMTISALPVTARILEDLKIYKTDVGFLIMSALSVNDIIGWVAFTIILGLFTQTGINFLQIAYVLSATIFFVIFSFTLGKKFSNAIITYFKNKNMPEPGIALTFTTILGMICGAITLKIGIHALFGFFIAGIIVGEAKDLSEKTRHVLSETVHAILVPLFFVNIGLKIDFFSNFNLFLVSLLSIVGIIARYLGAYIGTILSKQSPKDRNIISIAHIPGGEMQIVIGILALEYKLISEPIFVAILFSAVFSTLVIGPWMAWAIKQRKKVRFLDYIGNRCNIIDNKNINNLKDLLPEIVKPVLNSYPNLNSDEIISSILKREQLFSTAIGYGGAVPHARIKGINKPIISLTLLKNPIAWDSPDGNPVSWIFLLITPDNDVTEQLQILRSIATKMQQEKFRNKLINCESQDILKNCIYDIFNE